MSLGDFITENFRELAIIGGGGALAYQQGYFNLPSLPDVPEVSGIVLLGGLALAVGAYAAAGRITSLIPDPEGVFLV